MRWVLALLMLLGIAYAHDVRPGAIALREVRPSVFDMQIIAPLDGAGRPRLAAPQLSAGCTYVTPQQVRCAQGLDVLRLPELARRRVKVVVHARWLDGRRAEVLLREGETEAILDAPRLGWSAIGLGVTHLWQGWDHIGFVLALVLIAGTLRRVVFAITGFTLAHSLTLGATAAGIIRPPTAATELVIALSVLLLAAEAVRRRDTLTVRYPVGVATLFGLVHGIGFAGVLAGLEMPREALLTTVLAFNLGVELGQLGIVISALAIARLVGPWVPHGRQWIGYGIGLPAGIWTIERVAVWWG